MDYTQYVMDSVQVSRAKWEAMQEELRLLRAVAEAADAYERESMDAPYYDTTENDLKNFRSFREAVAAYRTRQSGAYQEGQ